MIPAATATLLVAIAAQAGNDFTIVAGWQQSRQRIGPYHFGSEPTYAAAVRAFGRPASSGSAEGSGVCTVRWTRLALEIRFASAVSDPCSVEGLRRGTWSGATVHAAPWRTARGLRVGDSVARLRALYPKARGVDRPPDPPSWLLVARQGEVGVTVYLQAYVWAGRVSALDLPPGNVSVSGRVSGASARTDPASGVASGAIHRGLGAGLPCAQQRRTPCARASAARRPLRERSACAGSSRGVDIRRADIGMSRACDSASDEPPTSAPVRAWPDAYVSPAATSPDS